MQKKVLKIDQMLFWEIKKKPLVGQNDYKMNKFWKQSPSQQTENLISILREL